MWDSYDEGRKHIRRMAEDVGRTEFLRDVMAGEFEAIRLDMDPGTLARVRELSQRTKAVGRYTWEEQRWIDGLKQRVLTGANRENRETK